MKKPNLCWYSLVLQLGLLAGLTGCYTVKQAVVFNNMYNSRVPLKNAAKDLKLSDRERKNLLKVPSLLAYAKERGLNVEGAYTYYIRMSDPVVSYSLQAAKPLKFEFETWWFPVIGRVPYLGFFSRGERDKKASELEKKGFDVNQAGVAAFSSLGWFEDPIYTSMVDDEEIEFSHVLLHELTHRTYWSPGSFEFNENFAEFVGTKLTLERFKGQESNDSVKRYLARREDNQKLKKWLVGMKTALEKIYDDAAMTDAVKYQAKAAIFSQATNKDFPSFESDGYKGLKTKRWNNAAILANTLYLPDTQSFDAAFRCFGKDSIGGFIERLRELDRVTNDSFKSLAKFCEK